jgi:hypothetical protein
LNNFLFKNEKNRYPTIVGCDHAGMSRDAVKFGRMSKKQREKVEDEVRYHRAQLTTTNVTNNQINCSAQLSSLVGNGGGQLSCQPSTGQTLLNAGSPSVSLSPVSLYLHPNGANGSGSNGGSSGFGLLNGCSTPTNGGAQSPMSVLSPSPLNCHSNNNSNHGSTGGVSLSGLSSGALLSNSASSLSGASLGLTVGLNGNLLVSNGSGQLMNGNETPTPSGQPIADPSPDSSVFEPQQSQQPSSSSLQIHYNGRFVSRLTFCLQIPR